MRRITGPSTVDLGGGRSGFVDENLVAGIEGTDVAAEWLNAVQEELMAVIEGAGLSPSSASLAQLRQAIRRMAARNAAALSAAEAAAVTLTPDQAGLVAVDATSADMVLTLPAANVAGGLEYVFLRLDDTARTVTIQRAGGDTIQGLASVALPAAGRMRLRSNGVGTWYDLGTQALPLSGGTLTGNLGITKVAPALDLRAAGSGDPVTIIGRRGTTARWVMVLGDGTAESGGNSGADFGIQRWNDAGSAIDTPLVIRRSDGRVFIGAGAGADVAGPVRQNGQPLMPVGMVAPFLATVAPALWVPLSGQALSRTAYALLWEHAQASGNLAATQAGKTKGQFGPGDGSTTFTLPDLQDEFLRGWITGTRAVGSTQADELRAHTHPFEVPANFGGGGFPAMEDGNPPNATVWNGTTGSTGGSETRPRNIATLYCIFAGV